MKLGNRSGYFLLKSKKRIKWLDFAKGITILFVVLLHFVGFITLHNNFFKIFQYIGFTFVMTVFFAISGYFYKPSNTWKKYKILLYKKSTSFIIPYIIFTFVNIFCLSIRSSLHLFINNFLRMFYLPIGYLWFLYVLFCIFIIVGLLDLFHVNLYLQVGISFILMLISCRMSWDFSFHNDGQNQYPIIRICGYIICFYIGILIKRFKLITILKNKWFMVISFIIWLGLLKIQYSIDNTFDTNTFGYVDIITKLLSIFVLLSIFINFPRNNWIFRYFDIYGRYTLLIYLVHIPIILLTLKIMAKAKLNITNHVFIAFPLMFVFAWFGSIVMCHISLHYKWVNAIFYPRKYIDEMVLKTR